MNGVLVFAGVMAALNVGVVLIGLQSGYVNWWSIAAIGCFAIVAIGSVQS